MRLCKNFLTHLVHAFLTSKFYLSGGNVGSGEDDVLLVLVNGPWVGDGFGVLDDGHRFSGQDGLIDAEGGGEDLHDTDISGDLVTD